MSKSVMDQVRGRVRSQRERVWRYSDFGQLPPQAVGQALSRLSRSGELSRVSRGVYFSGRKTVFGASRPNPAQLRKLAAERAPVFPSGVAAAAMLRLTTQNAARPEFATTALSLPRKLLGESAVVHTRRPRAWRRLRAQDAAALEVLRDRARASELSASDTVARILEHLRKDDRFERLLGVAATEPPRVRAMLGALGEMLGEDPAALERLRRSLNPLSRFDFGPLATLSNARRWQAKPLGDT